MSTYLVAYVVGEYDYVETKDAYGVSMRVYTPVGKKEHGQFAMDVRLGMKASECQSLLLRLIDSSKGPSFLCRLLQHQISHCQSRSNRYFGFRDGVRRFGCTGRLEFDLLVLEPWKTGV